MRNKPNCLNDLQAAGFNYEDACALRRIAMTLHRWHELECGDSNYYGSWSIERGKEAPRPRWENPWQGRAIAVPLRRLLPMTTLFHSSAFDVGQSVGVPMDEMDAYVLRQPNGSLEVGFRYGNAGHEYLSPTCTDPKAADALACEYSEDGAPFLVRHHYAHGRGKDSVTRTPIPDRERGALKRLAKIMARYPGFAHYVQGDPRGASLYILRPTDLNGSPAGSQNSSDFREWLSANYSRGIAVHK